MLDLRFPALLTCGLACLASNCNETVIIVDEAEAVLLGNPYDIQPDGMSLSWIESDLDSFDRYELYRSMESGVSTEDSLILESTDPTETIFADSGLEATETYYYRIWVYSTSGDSAASNEVSGTTAWDSSPSAIQLEDPYDITATSMTLAWSASESDDFAYYRLYRSETEDVGEDASLVYSTEERGVLEHADDALTPGTQYCYRVYVEDEWGITTGSNVACATTLDTEAPYCSISRSPVSRPPGEPFFLEAVSCYDNNTPVEDLTVTWDFGDGSGWTTPTTDKATSHSYAYRGGYTVQVSVSDSVYSSIASVPLVVTDTVDIPGGTYSVGRESDTTPWPDLEPARSVSLEAFRMDAYEVTVQAYTAFLNDQGGALGNYSSQQEIAESVDGVYTAHHGHEEHPITGVTWYDASAYCEWTGGWLPTEAQWEAAARGPSDGTNYEYPWGDEVPASLDPVPVNHDDPTNGSVVDVASYETGVTAWDEDVVLWQMAGNADEWVADIYDEDYYQWANDNGDNTEPTGPATSPYDETYYVTRGGSFANDDNPLRVSFRCYADPWEGRGNARGFRCASSPPVVTQVAAGGRHSCSIDSYGLLTCWGDDSQGQATPPGGIFADIDLGEQHSCAVETSGAIACWGDDTLGQVSGVPDGSFTQVSAGYDHTCALDSSGTVHCWGDDTYGQVSGAPSGSFVQVEAGDWHGCALDSHGLLSCWGITTDDCTTPPDASFSSFATGHLHSCALDAHGAVSCWGGNDDGESTPPKTAFATVSAGQSHSCGTDAHGTIDCWGSDYHDQDASPDGTFSQVSAGAYHSCGLDSLGAVWCWGWDFYGQSTVP